MGDNNCVRHISISRVLTNFTLLGIKPLYVFDGKPPDMKVGELEKRSERREEAQKALEKATELGIQEDINKFQRRLVKVTRQVSVLILRAVSL